jgi:hemoglobin
MSTIYDQLGGKATFDAVSEYFYGLVLNDDLLKPFFAGKDTEGLKRHQAEFLAAAAGGPAFTGRSMEKAHAGLNITDEAFGRVAQHLSATLDHFKVSTEIKDFFMNAAGGLKGNIVGK